MWYFTWFIGITMAVLLSVMHALWLEVQIDESILRERDDVTSERKNSSH
jgi:cyd operon protein YbgT